MGSGGVSWSSSDIIRQRKDSPCFCEEFNYSDAF